MALQLPGVPFKLTPEDMGQLSHAPDYVGGLMKGFHAYDSAINAANKPRQIEADIFSKEIGPLAALASNPNFTGFNPEIQKMIAGRIGSYLGGHHGSQSFGSQTTPGYASDQDIYNRVTQGAKGQFSRSGRTETVLSRIAGELDRIGAPEYLVKLLGGRHGADESGSYDQATREAAHRLMLKGYSESDANSIVEHKPGESDIGYAKRLRSLFVPTSDSPPPENNASIGNQDALQAQSNDLSGQIRSRFGVDVPPTVLFNALSNHKGGKFDMGKWLKKNGYLK